MSLDIESLDKSNFQCFQLKDDSVYFGEVQYLSEDGKLNDPREDPEAKTKGRLQRHGFGIQMFGTTPENFLCKYEGYWNLDRQNGQCRIWYPDKSTYEGTVKNGIKEGFGKFVWPNQDHYEGNWRNNRFEGGGTFSHHDGSIRKGLFKNNYYVQDGEIFINPFLSNEDTEEFLSRRHEISQIKEKNKKQKLFFFEKTGDYNQLANLVQKSNQNGRIPLILSSKQNNSSMQKVFTNLTSITKKKFYDFDLRKIQHKKETDKTHNEYLNQIKSNLSETLVKGHSFIINLDESDVTFEEIFYPDIREFYKPSCFPSQIWELEELKKYQVHEKIIANTENQFALDVNSDFNIFVWSKIKFDEELENKAIIEKIERRFSQILPMIKLDYIMVTSEQPVEEEPQEQEQQQQQDDLEQQSQQSLSKKDTKKPAKK